MNLEPETEAAEPPVPEPSFKKSDIATEVAKLHKEEYMHELA
jgi:hypothetical protein